MKVLDLFSGIGGFSLAGHPHGFETAAFCEYDKHAQKVLEKRFPNVPIYPDVRELSKEMLDADGITIDVICGGFPCQPFSVAGEQRGSDDDRHLWPEMLRLIKEIRPRWVIGENVSGFVSMALDDVSLDLENEGYEVRSLIVPACAKDAYHRRDRVWIMGYTKHARWHRAKKLRGNEKASNQWWQKKQKEAWQPQRTSGPLDVPSI